MKKINLKEVKIFKDATKSDYFTASIVNELSDYIYKQVPYSPILDSLSERIKESGGILEISKSEEDAIMSLFNYGMLPVMRDAIIVVLNNDAVEEKTGDLSGKSDDEKRALIAQAMQSILKEVRSKTDKEK